MSIGQFAAAFLAGLAGTWLLDRIDHGKADTWWSFIALITLVYSAIYAAT